MSDSEPDALQRALGGSPPDSVAGLPAETRDRLADQLRARRRRLEEDGAAATERALRGVPAPFRGLVRRTLS